MKTLPPSSTERASVEAFETLIYSVGEAQARLVNLQSTCQTFFKKERQPSRLSESTAPRLR